MTTVQPTSCRRTFLRNHQKRFLENVPPTDYNRDPELEEYVYSLSCLRTFHSCSALPFILGANPRWRTWPRDVFFIRTPTIFTALRKCQQQFPWLSPAHYGQR